MKSSSSGTMEKGEFYLMNKTRGECHICNDKIVGKLMVVMEMAAMVVR